MNAIVDELNRSGMRARLFRKHPFGVNGAHLFAVSTKRNGRLIRLHEGIADIDVPDVNRDYRQGVLHVREQARIIEQYVTPPQYSSWGEAARLGPGVLRSMIFLPDGTNVTCDRNWIATAEIPATDLTFLVGIDEVAHFISVLPKTAGSVEEAHQMLRPPNLSDATVRQGEWFFDPGVLPVDAVRILPADGKTIPLARGSSHHATEVCRDKGGLNWARGQVIDTRRGHHKPLVLADWHRVVHNLEQSVPGPSKGRKVIQYD